jgi:peptidoglycan/LPS O-acetylase OafA/YrhL
MSFMVTLRALFTSRRGIAALMVVGAASLAVASALHLSGADGNDATAAGVAEAVICVVLLGGAIAYRRVPWGRTAALAATGFAILGFCYGLSLTVRGGDVGDVAYHATVLPLLIVTLILIIRAKTGLASGHETSTSSRDGSARATASSARRGQTHFL